MCMDRDSFLAEKEDRQTMVKLRVVAESAALFERWGNKELRQWQQRGLEHPQIRKRSPSGQLLWKPRFEYDFDVDSKTRPIARIADLVAGAFRGDLIRWETGTFDVPTIRAERRIFAQTLVIGDASNRKEKTARLKQRTDLFKAWGSVYRD